MQALKDVFLVGRMPLKGVFGGFWSKKGAIMPGMG
jgi:hypothetical protein